jgi:hypothetical protein
MRSGVGGLHACAQFRGVARNGVLCCAGPALYLITDRIELADKAVVSAEKVGYVVNPGLKADIKARRTGR